MIVAVLIGAVLPQKSEGGGLGMGGGAGFMSSRGTSNLLTRMTAISGSWLLCHQPVFGLVRRPRSQAKLNLPTGPATPSQPGGTPIAPPTSGGVLDTLKKVDEQQSPPAPSGPQAPRSQ